MVSRRAVLRTGGAALLAAVAGCASDGAPSSDATTGTTADGTTTTDVTTTTGGTTVQKRLLAADTVSPADVPDGATVAVAVPELHELVETAASADGRVDYDEIANADGDQTFVLGEFEYLRFRGETYEPMASFAGFAAESSTRYDLEAASDVPGDADVVEYDALNDSERAIADEMLEHGSFTVGRHEDPPDAARAFAPQDYLRVDDRTYLIRVAIGDPPPHHMLTLDDADPDADAQVVTVADRVPEYAWVGAFRTAIEEGDAALRTVANPEGLVEYVEADYVVTATAVAEVGVVELVE